MTLKNLSALNSSVGSCSNETQEDDHRRGLSAGISRDALFHDPGLPHLGEQALRVIQSQRFEDDDYEIALVRRKNRTLGKGLIRQPSPNTGRALSLRITWRELLDRVRREVNRSAERSMIRRFGEVCVNFWTMEISRSGKPVVLSAQEFKLLRFFIKNPGRVFSRNELLNEVWGYTDYPSTRTVDNHICALRQKLELTPARPIHFLTVHGIGYRFVPLAA